MIKPTEAQQEFILQYYDSLTEYRLALQANGWSLDRLIDQGGLGIWAEHMLDDIQKFKMPSSVSIETLAGLNNPIVVTNVYKRAIGRFLQGMVLNQP